MPDLSLADKVREYVETPERVLTLDTDIAERRKLARHVKNLIQTSHRVRVEYDAATAASKLGQLHPELLLEMLHRARLPYPKMFIEWPVRAQFEGVGIAEHIAEDAPEWTGVFLEALNPNGTQYRITHVGFTREDDSGGLVLSPLTIYVDTEDPARVPENMRDTLLICEKAHMSRLTMRMLLLGSAYVGPRPVDVKTVADLPEEALDEVLGLDPGSPLHETRKQICQQVTRHASWQFTPELPSYKEALQNEKYAGRRIAEIAQASVMECLTEGSGMFREVISILALINARDYSSEVVTKSGTGGRFVRGKRIPYMTHRQLTIKVPREVVVNKLIKVIGEGIPRRRHEVTGHWCNSHKVGDPTCKHDPIVGCQRAVYVAETENMELCLVCGHRRWWRATHERGDAQIGYVTKDTVVKKK